jgi:hypothetical protein
MLEYPGHLLLSGVQSRAIRFPWDDWNTESVEEAPDDFFVEALSGVSDRAVLALTTAIAEWVVYRFEPLNPDQLPGQFLEAAWAAGVNWGYLSEIWDSVADPDKWNGPVRGPVAASMMAVDEVLHAARLGENLKTGSRWASNIAAHVLPRPEPFREWRDRVVQRLAVLYPRDDDDLIGDVVAREVFDLTREFRLAETESLINRFLRSLDYSSNPFLVSPAEFVEAGLKGTPYVFDLLRDREERLYL